MRLVQLDEKPHVCSYLPEQEAWEESYLLLEATDVELDLLLKTGYRSFGKYFFRPKCRKCHRCVPLRIPVNRIVPTKSQRKVLKKCQEISVMIDTPRYSSEKFEVYLDHIKRFPGKEVEHSEEGFVLSFYDTTHPSLEFSYYLEERLIAVGYVNISRHALSSAYFCYLREFSKFSLGVYSVMIECFHARQMKKEFLYLGYYIEQNRYMCYKGDYVPNEILTETGRWIPFYDSEGNRLIQSEPQFPPFPVIQSEVDDD